MTLPFPVEIAREIPNPFKTADLKLVAVGRDGFEYAVKRLVDGEDLPASEWFCYHLGYKLQLALPAFAVMVNGSTESFGSRFEGGVRQWSDFSPVEHSPLLLSCGIDMSRILALDLFVGNDDRHLNNFLFREQKIGGQVSVLAMDFSRSLFIRGWPKDVVPMSASTKTMMVIDILKSLGVWDSTVASLVLASIQSISPTEVERWLSDMPKDWVEPSRIAEVKAWWGSAEFDQRLTLCRGLV